MYILHSYSWRPGDTVWHVASRLLAAAGWVDIPTFVQAIWAVNPGLDWRALAPETPIDVPFWQAIS